MGIFDNSLSLTVMATSLVMFSLPFFLNYAILQTMPGIGFQIMIPTVFMVSFFNGAIASAYSSSSDCGMYKKGLAVKKGIKQAVISTAVYALVWFFPWFKSPFVEIGGENILANSIGESFILGMTSIALVIDNYFSSQKEGCTMSKEEADKAYAKMEKKLHSREKKSAPAKVTITH
jgi:hypothetical protein